MDQSGVPPHCEEDCNDDNCCWHPRFAAAKPDNGRCTSALLETTILDGSVNWFDTAIRTAKSDAATVGAKPPFILQSGQMLYIVSSEPIGWIVAELVFDRVNCGFIEYSRIRFDWPREAFGRLLSRTGIATGPSSGQFDAISDSFRHWVASQFVH